MGWLEGLLPNAEPLKIILFGNLQEPFRRRIFGHDGITTKWTLGFQPKPDETIFFLPKNWKTDWDFRIWKSELKYRDSVLKSTRLGSSRRLAAVEKLSAGEATSRLETGSAVLYRGEYWKDRTPKIFA